MKQKAAKFSIVDFVLTVAASYFPASYQLLVSTARKRHTVVVNLSGEG